LSGASKVAYGSTRVATSEPELSPLVREVAACLGGGSPEGTNLVFVRPIQFIEGRLKGLDGTDLKSAMQSLARFGWFLHEKKGSPIASRALMQVLEQTANKIAPSRVER
jgi:hypothetical protein